MFQLFQYLKPYRLLLMGIIVLTFLQNLGTLYIPTLTADIINIGVMNGDVPYILKKGGAMLLVAGIIGISAIALIYLSASTATAFGRDLRAMIFSKANTFSLNDFNQFGTSSMIMRNTNDVAQVQQATLLLLELMLPAPIMAIGGLILAFSKDKVLALVVLFTMLILAFFLFFIGRKVIPLFQQMQTKMDGINRILRESVTGVRVIRAFDRVNDDKTRFNHAATDYAETAIKVNKVFAFLMPTILLVMNLTVVAILWFGGIRISGGYMQIGDIMAVIEYAMNIMYALIMFAVIFLYIPRAEVCARRINEILNVKIEIEDSKDKITYISKFGHIAFHDVTFSYPNAEEPILSGLSFESHPGETTAIIGGTGSGKSTIANIIPRFYDIQSGSITIDGTDIRKMSQKALRDKIGLIPQKAFLFSGTIADNLRYGNKDASLEDMIQAAKIAQAHDFISNLDLGYDSIVSQGGNNFSGGQKQRLAIARAFVRKPEIYIFDDSFSALDFKTDAMLRKALKEETKEASVIIIAQRISTIMDADRIIVLEDGKIVAIGTHSLLLKTCEVYQQIAASQLKASELVAADKTQPPSGGNQNG